jgi:hypothetical protein
MQKFFGFCLFSFHHSSPQFKSAMKLNCLTQLYHINNFDVKRVGNC